MLFRSGYQAPPLPPGRNQFDDLQLLTTVQKAPRIHFKDLEEKVTSSVRYNSLPMRVEADFIPITPASILTDITMQFQRSDLQFQQKDGVAKAVLNVYARISSMSQRTVSVF